MVKVAVDALPRLVALEQLGKVPLTLPIAPIELHVGVFTVDWQEDQLPDGHEKSPQPTGEFVPSI
jgi:hypothetical protein